MSLIPSIGWTNTFTGATVNSLSLGDESSILAPGALATATCAQGSAVNIRNITKNVVVATGQGSASAVLPGGWYAAECAAGDRRGFGVVYRPSRLPFGLGATSYLSRLVQVALDRNAGLKPQWARLTEASWDALWPTAVSTPDFTAQDWQLAHAKNAMGATKFSLILSGADPSWADPGIRGAYKAAYQAHCSAVFDHYRADLPNMVFELYNEPSAGSWRDLYNDYTTAARDAATALGVTVKLAGGILSGYNSVDMTRWANDGTLTALDYIGWHRYNDDRQFDEPDTGLFSLIAQLQEARGLTGVGSKVILMTETSLGGRSALGWDYTGQPDATSWAKGVYKTVKRAVIDRAYGVVSFPTVLDGAADVASVYASAAGYAPDGTVSHGPEPKTLYWLAALSLLSGMTYAKSDWVGGGKGWLFTFNTSNPNRPLSVVWALAGQSVQLPKSLVLPMDCFGNTLVGLTVGEEPMFCCPVKSTTPNKLHADLLARIK